MKKSILFLSLLFAALVPARAQVTSEPSPLVEDDSNVVIYFHADQGTGGLANLPATTPVYAHTGVITSQSKSDTDWKYAPAWLDNAPKYRLIYVSNNLYRLDIGSMRQYYEIGNPTEQIKKLAFVFRTADGSKEGKGEGGKDIFINVLQKGADVILESSLKGNMVNASTGEVTFTASCSVNANLAIEINGENIGSASDTKQLTAAYTFTKPGNYTVSAIAATQSGSVTDDMEIIYAAPSQAIDYLGGIPMPGAREGSDGEVLFCLPAPEKESVVLVGSWNDYRIDANDVMNYQVYDGQKYFWTSVKGIDPDKYNLYYYYVDGQYRVGDPYARLVLNHDYDSYIPEDVFPGLPAYPSDKVKEVPLAIYRPTLFDYEWKYTDFKRAANENLIIYELLLRDFTGTEGEAKGDGNINLAFSRLNYLQNLGVNAVELMPIQEFNGNISWGYNPNFYFAPDKAYGTPVAYKELIDYLHAKGMAVILDVVLNQSDWMHPWYQMYPAGSNPMYNASAPHAYSVLNDWNQSHPLVQRQWKDMIQYWLKEYNVDGFRFDLVKGLGDNDSYANSGDAATNAYNASRVARMRQLQKWAQEVKPDVIFLNENLATPKEENEMAETGQLNWTNFNNAGCQFAMGYQDGAALSGMYAPDNSRTWGSTVSYLESHDEQRLAYKQNQWGEMEIKGNHSKSMQRLGSAAAQMLMAPGAHMIWQFSEMGNAQNTKNNDDGNNTDPKTVCWSLLDNPDNNGLMLSYRELIGARIHNTDLFAEDASFTSRCGGSDWANGRMLVSSNSAKKIITAVNPNLEGDITMDVDLSGFDRDGYYILSCSYGAEPRFDAAAGTITIPANTYALIASSDVVGVEKTVIDGESGFRIASAEGGIKVISGTGLLEIYGTDGMKAASLEISGGEYIPLPAGIYIARCGNRTQKAVSR